VLLSGYHTFAAQAGDSSPNAHFGARTYNTGTYLGNYLGGWQNLNPPVCDAASRQTDNA